jgi:hypothetical protein
LRGRLGYPAVLAPHGHGSEHEMRTGTAVIVALLLLLIVVAAGIQLLVIQR